MLVQIHHHTWKYRYLLDLIALWIVKKLMNTPFPVWYSVIIKICLILIHIIFYYFFYIISRLLRWYIHCILCINNNHISKVISYYKLSLCVVNNRYVTAVILNYIIKLTLCMLLFYITYVVYIFPCYISFNNLKLITILKHQWFYASTRNILHNILWKTDCPSYCWNLSFGCSACSIKFRLLFSYDIYHISSSKYKHSAVPQISLIIRVTIRYFWWIAIKINMRYEPAHITVIP